MKNVPAWSCTDIAIGSEALKTGRAGNIHFLKRLKKNNEMDNRMFFDKTIITQLDEKQARNDVFCYLLN